ncbi:MAG: MFS transporter [Nocardioidaceae bacterium]
MVLAPYRRLAGIPGGVAFSATGLVARMPISMTSLGIIVLVSARTGSYAQAGSISAAEVIAAAITSPWQGRLYDRFGQARVIVPAVICGAIAMTLLIVTIEQGWPAPLPHAAAALTGFSFPMIGSCVRARWRYVVPDRDLLNTAFAVEAVVDEAVFVTGPPLVTFLGTSVNPRAGLASAAGLGLVGTLALAVQRRTEPPVGHEGHSALVRAPLNWTVLGPLLVVSGGLGSLFGSTEVVTVAFATDHGNRADAGLLLALWALGSLVAGAVVGALSMRRSALSRMRIGTAVLTLVLVPLLVVPSIPWLAALMLFSGLAVSPTLVSTMSLAEESVPPARLAEGIGWVTTGLATGIAPGAAISGWLVDHHGTTAGYVVPLVSGGLAALVAALMRAPSRTHTARAR